MKKTESINTFVDGLVMDINPTVTPNTGLCNALNATIITMNGNENILQNDMGNGRVETAYLPEGYIPLGTTELGGIVYVVSYNPLNKKCLIGSFPSPERNITSDELGDKTYTLKISDFIDDKGNINSITKRIILSDKDLYPGDKFLISCQEVDGKNYISAYGLNDKLPNIDLLPRYLKFNVVAIHDSGSIDNLNNSLTWFEENKYYLYNKPINKKYGKLDLDEYRGLVKSNYNVFNSRSKGKLAILAELECIDSFLVSWDAKKDNSGNWELYLFVNWEYNNSVSRDKINLYGVLVSGYDGNNTEINLNIIINNYPSKDGATNTDILNNLDNIFYTPYYVDSIPNNLDDLKYDDNNNIKIPRRNDGTDNLFLIHTPISLGNIGVANLTITPLMPFGKLDYLKLNFSLDLNKLGTGSIEFVEYRYYVDENGVTLNWGLEAYPERNKKINNVSFEFFEYNDCTFKWINAHHENIDNNFLISTDNKNYAWNGTGSSFTFDDLRIDHTKPGDLNNISHEINIEDKASYSGNFTEHIQGLNLDSLYLVIITINYNSEKYIKYTRLMYTSTIFNQYYFDVKDNDYKNIELEDILSELDLVHLYIDKVSKLNISSNSLLLLNLLPLYQKTSTDISNSVRNTCDMDINIDIKLEVPKPFSATFNITSLTSENKFTHDSESVRMDYKGIKTLYEFDQKPTDNGKLDLTNTNNILSGHAKIESNIPLKIDYSLYSTLDILYKLLPLNIDNQYLVYSNGSNWASLVVRKNYKEFDSGSKKELELPYYRKRNGNYELSILGYSTIHLGLYDLLLKYDVIALCAAPFAFVPDDGFLIQLGYGGIGTNYLLNKLGNIYSYSKFKNKFATILYAILDTDNNVRLFTFGIKDYPTEGWNKNWYGIQPTKHTHTSTQWLLSQSLPFAFILDDVRDLESDLIKKPFLNYFKLVSAPSALDVYKWKYINYYNTYTLNINITIKYTSNFKLSVNDVEIIPINNIKNLHYNSIKESICSTTIKNEVNIEEYITSLFLDALAALNENGEIISIEKGDPTCLYSRDGKVLRYLKLDDGLGSNFTLLPDSRFGISNYNKFLVKDLGTLCNADNTIVGLRTGYQMAINQVRKINHDG